MRVQGRSACADLVDCSVKLDGSDTRTAALVGDLATALCAPFGINVTIPGGQGRSLLGPIGQVPPFQIMLNETPYDVLEKLARWNQLIVHDGEQGSLVLEVVNQTGTPKNGLAQGKDIQSATVSYRKTTGSPSTCRRVSSNSSSRTCSRT